MTCDWSGSPPDPQIGLLDDLVRTQLPAPARTRAERPERQPVVGVPAVAGKRGVGWRGLLVLENEKFLAVTPCGSDSDLS